MTTQQNEEQKGPLPLEGEQGIPSVAVPRGDASFLKKVGTVLAIGAILGTSVYFTYFAHRGDKSAEKKADEKGAKIARADGFRPKKFDSPPEGAPTLLMPTAQAATLIQPVPGVEPINADPIAVRGSSAESSGSRGGTQANGKTISPVDSSATVALVANQQTPSSLDTSTANDPSVVAAKERLSTLQNAMGGLTDTLKGLTRPAMPQAAPPPEPPGLVSQMKASAVPHISPSMMVNQSLTMPKGTEFNCALKTRIVSELSGFVSCQVLRNVYSMDGRVLLIERGSHLDGEYTAKIKNGQSRIFVVWSRVRSVNGVSIDIASPATGPLGEAGISGYVDNHWGERFGGAILVTMIDDAVKVTVANQNSHAGTVISQDTGDAASKVAEKMLDASVNIPPTIYKNQGEVVGIYVSGDVDFSSVYDLKVAER